MKLFGSPTSEYHPENKVEGNELAFTLPGFVVHKNRPSKELILSKYTFSKNEFLTNKKSNEKIVSKNKIQNLIDNKPPTINKQKK